MMSLQILIVTNMLVGKVNLLCCYLLFPALKACSGNVKLGVEVGKRWHV